MHLYHKTTSANRNLSRYQRPSSHVLEASVKIPKEIMFCNQTSFIIAYKVRISCKEPLSYVLYVFVTSKSSFVYFITAPDVRIVYVKAPVSLTESVFM